MKKTVVSLGRTINPAAVNIQRLMKEASAVAEKIVAPEGIEFASFAHKGSTYALSARLIVEVDLLESKVPQVVIRKR